MTDGLWVSPDKFISFADMAADRQLVLAELYSSPFGVDVSDFLLWLPDPDPVLRKTGDGIQVLRDLTADDKVISSIQLRKLGTLKKKDYTYTPGHAEDKEADAESKRMRDMLADDLENVDLYNLFSQILDAPYYGMSPVEPIWEARAGYYRIKDLKPRPPEWFGFTAGHEMYFRGGSGMEGIPFGKLVTARHFPEATNPYGLRLLSRCLWPVAIKKGGIKFWTMLCEKFGLPWVIGKAPSGALEAERRLIASQLAAMVQDAVAVVSSGTEVDVHGFEAKSGSLHPDLVKYMDAAIARVLMLQTLTSEVGDRGSYAAASVHEEVLNDCREADETLLVTFMNDLAWTYTRLNSAAALSPTFAFIEPEDYAAQADLDAKLHGVGVRFRKVHFSRHYGLAEDEFDLDATPKPTPGRTDDDGVVDLAAGGGFTPDQQAIEDLVARISPEAAEALSGNERLLIQAVLDSESYDEAFQKILDLYPQLTVDTLQDLMERVLLNAGLFGQYVTRQEVDGAS